jgi:hypothetical protein
LWHGRIDRPDVAGGWHPMALTPNHAQIEYVRSTYPSIPVFHGKFEQLPVEKYGGGFGTVIMSESFQYMKLKQAFFTLLQVLRPGGRWIICDYFRTSANGGGSRHMRGVRSRRIARCEDETGIRTGYHAQRAAHTRLRAHAWRTTGGPLVNFVIAKLRKKRPAIHYVLEEVIEELRAYMLDQLQIVNPAEFARDRKYMLLVVERI